MYSVLFLSIWLALDWSVHTHGPRFSDLDLELLTPNTVRLVPAYCPLETVLFGLDSPVSSTCSKFGACNWSWIMCVEKQWH